MVELTSAVIEAGLGGTLRNIFVNESYVAGCWPLAEMVDTTARDITRQRNHGTYISASGFTRGVTVDIPEGTIANTFDGTGYVEVPDDGPGDPHMSLADGDMDICCLLKTSTNDATLRCIVCKQVGGPTGNGYFLGIQSGAVVFYLEVGGSVLFNFSRGSIADNALHDIHAIYDTINHEAWIEIDGVISGAKVTGIAATDPAYQAVALRIGKFTDGSGGFIGTLAYVMIGREGSTTLGARIHAARSWTAITTDVAASVPVIFNRGISSSKMWDLVAGRGQLTFGLKNWAAGSRPQSYYSLGHANCRTGFTIGTPIRQVLTYAGTPYTTFRGRIVQADPDPGAYGPRVTHVLCEDWFGTAAASFFGAAPVQVGQPSHTALAMLIDQASMPPPAVSLGTGSQTLPYAFDAGQSERQGLLQEADKIATSEFGYFFQKGDGTVTFVPRFTRQASDTLAVTLTDTFDSLDVGASVDDVVNVVRCKVYPPTVDAAATSVLYTLPCDTTNTHVVGVGETIQIEGPYTKPSDRTTRVGGTAVVTPVTSTDYTANALADGTGADKTSAMSVDVQLGANLIRAWVTNTGDVAFYITKFQVRGKVISRDAETDLVLRDETSVRQYEERALDLDMKYQGSVTSARGVCQALLDVYANPAMRARSVSFNANRDATHMTQALVREVGDRVGLVETVTGLAAGVGHFINEVELTVTQPNLLRCRWTVAPGWPETLLVAFSGADNGTHDFNGGPLELVAAGDYTFLFNRTGDTIRLHGAAGGGGGGVGRADSSETPGGGGGGGGACQVAGLNVAIAVTSYTGKVGAPGAGGTSGAGTTGGTTEFRVPAGTIHLQLPGGGGGGGASGTTGGTAGAGAAAGTGSGNVAGTNGGSGGNNGANGNSGTSNASGAAGAGGGGSSGQGGNFGGDGLDQDGGAAASAGNAGNAADGGGAQGGLLSSGSPGGGGGGGGGVFLAGGYRGGGGGGSAGATGSVGNGGAGGSGALVLTKL